MGSPGAAGDRGATSGSAGADSAGSAAQDTQSQSSGDTAAAPKQGDGDERAPETKGAKPDTAPQDSGSADASGGKGGESGKDKPGKVRSGKSSRSASKERKHRDDDGGSKRKDSTDVPCTSLRGVMAPLASSLAKAMYQGELILRDQTSSAGPTAHPAPAGQVPPTRVPIPGESGRTFVGVLARVMDVHRDYLVRDGFGGLESISTIENLSDSEI
ncbi:Dual specificity protein kinase shkA [Phytophthora cinnamomi]|uniref:Dual specificity protein kinase shkA n=1 Tax=Phytophthora cinnamomi TaxID=4785 RepID=UPI00355A0528|nr:Dual specificity protein kinase shkA [Phytophthora cinnamomi]